MKYLLDCYGTQLFVVRVTDSTNATYSIPCDMYLIFRQNFTDWRIPIGEDY